MISAMIRQIGHSMPDVPLFRSVPHRLLKPLHTNLGLSGGEISLLGFKMLLDPRECVDGALWFSPQFYDHQEIACLMNLFPDDGVLVDAGSNIGFWSLRFAHRFPKGRICSIEANPSTFGILCHNIALNGFENIHPVNVGIADRVGELTLYCNDTGNRGGDSFSEVAADRAVTIAVAVKPLASILQEEGIERIDVMKMDIEGFERPVLQHFFREAPATLRPRYICVETIHAPDVLELLSVIGYVTILTAKDNSVMVLK